MDLASGTYKSGGWGGGCCGAGVGGGGEGCCGAGVGGGGGVSQVAYLLRDLISSPRHNIPAATTTSKTS